MLLQLLDICPFMGMNLVENAYFFFHFFLEVLDPLKTMFFVIPKQRAMRADKLPVRNADDIHLHAVNSAQSIPNLYLLLLLQQHALCFKVPNRRSVFLEGRHAFRAVDENLLGGRQGHNFLLPK